ncbi:hypothetical protein C8F01DRAFT_1181564 [Mycena amicta]|nr:hypothetical protein C8F01DRAFT_1181564 [Mycena amicta]
MLDWHNQFRAWITIEDRPAEEYDVQISEADNTVTCWIASELGKARSCLPPLVSYSRKNRLHTRSLRLIGKIGHFAGDSDGRVLCDGILCGGKIIRAGTERPAARRKSGLTDGTTIKPFIFSGNDDAVLEAPSNFSNLGLIQLVIYPVAVGEAMLGGKAVLPVAQIHERAESVVTQQVQLGAVEILQKPQPVLRTTRTGPAIVTFCFKYGERPDYLRGKGVAPLMRSSAELESPALHQPNLSVTASCNEDVNATEAKRMSAERKASDELMDTQQEDKKPCPKIEPELASVIDLTLDARPRPRPKKKVQREAGARGDIIDLT